MAKHFLDRSEIPNSADPCQQVCQSPPPPPRLEEELVSLDEICRRGHLPQDISFISFVCGELPPPPPPISIGDPHGR